MCVSSECVCNQLGSDPSSCGSSSECVCDAVSGRCPCLPLVAGQQCDRCEADSWNLGSGRGCEACACNPQHTYGTSCNEVPEHTFKLYNELYWSISMFCYCVLLLHYMYLIPLITLQINDVKYLPNHYFHYILMIILLLE